MSRGSYLTASEAKFSVTQGNSETASDFGLEASCGRLRRAVSGHNLQDPSHKKQWTTNARGEGWGWQALLARRIQPAASIFTASELGLLFTLSNGYI